MYIGTVGMFLGMSPGIRMYQYSVRRRMRRRASAPRANVENDQSNMIGRQEAGV